jgi:hypothetical protein
LKAAPTLNCSAKLHALNVNGVNANKLRTTLAVENSLTKQALPAFAVVPQAIHFIYAPKLDFRLWQLGGVFNFWCGA